MSYKSDDQFSGVLVAKTKVILKNLTTSQKFCVGSRYWRVLFKHDYYSQTFGKKYAAVELKLVADTPFSGKFTAFFIDSQFNKRFEKTSIVFDYKSSHPIWIPILSTDEFKGLNEVDWSTVGVFIEEYSTSIQEYTSGLNYRKFLNDEEVNDLKIICGQKEFFVFKAILSSHSEVFQKMFSNKMSEQKTNHLLIEDIGEEVMDEFIKFLYFGTSEKLDQLKEELLYVSDKYQVLDLKKICENFMFIEINEKNAIKLLLTFDKYNCNEMKTKTIAYIKTNINSVRKDSDKESMAELMANRDQYSSPEFKSLFHYIDNVNQYKDVNTSGYVNSFTYHYIK